MATIMAVDDSTSMRQMVSFTLQSVGYEVLEAANGEEALKLAKTKKFDLVIADLNMPNMDGVSLVKSLRSLKDYRFTPKLILTTESQDLKRQEGKAEECNLCSQHGESPSNDHLLNTVTKKQALGDDAC